MKFYNLFLIILISLLTTFTGCEIIGGIFKAGFWVGIIVVVLLILIVVWLVNRMRK
jgi:hypothetical protein